MANFCEKCGARLNGTSAFCTQCGSRVPTPAAQSRQPRQTARPAQPAQQQYRQPRQAQPIQQPRQQVRQPQRTVQRPAQQSYRQPQQTQAYRQPKQQAPQQQYRQPVQTKQPKQVKKAKKAQTAGRKKSPAAAIIIIAASVVLIGTFLITAFVAPGFLKAKKQQSLTPSSDHAAAMLEFARELEASGNYDAAAQIYSMLPDVAEAGAAEEAKRIVDDSPEKKILDGAGDARDVLNDINDLMED